MSELMAKWWAEYMPDATASTSPNSTTRNALWMQKSITRTMTFVSMREFYPSALWTVMKTAVAPHHANNVDTAPYKRRSDADGSNEKRPGLIPPLPASPAAGVWRVQKRPRPRIGPYEFRASSC